MEYVLYKQPFNNFLYRYLLSKLLQFNYQNSQVNSNSNVKYDSYLEQFGPTRSDGDKEKNGETYHEGLLYIISVLKVNFTPLLTSSAECNKSCC